MTQIDEQQLLKLVEKFHKEVVDFGDKFAESVKPLNAALQKVEASEKKWWVVHKTLITIIATLLTILLLVVGIGLTMKYTNLCVVNIGSSSDAQSAELTSCKK
jgi:t-SNARE complex subunit (syntaxin)